MSVCNRGRGRWCVLLRTWGTTVWSVCPVGWWDEWPIFLSGWRREWGEPEHVPESSHTPVVPSRHLRSCWTQACSRCLCRFDKWRGEWLMLCGCRNGHRQQLSAANLRNHRSSEENVVTFIRLRDARERRVLMTRLKLTAVYTLTHTHTSHTYRGSASTVWTHWCCGPTAVQFCAKATIAPASRSP